MQEMIRHRLFFLERFIRYYYKVQVRDISNSPLKSIVGAVVIFFYLFESPSLFRVEIGCNPGDTPLARAGYVETIDTVDGFCSFLWAIWTLQKPL